MTPINLVDVIRNNTVYNGATYTIQNTWKSGSNNTKTFPVTIDLIINRKNGLTYTATKTANNQSELTNLNASIEQDAKRYIDADNIPPPTHSLNHSVSYTTRVNNYFGGFYEVFNTYNTNGTSDFPVQISGIYGVANQ